MHPRTLEQLEQMDPEKRAKAVAALDRLNTPESRAELIAAREVIEAEVRDTGGIMTEDGVFHPVKAPLVLEYTFEGTRFRSARESKGMTLDDVAGVSGLERSAISKLELGQTNPTMRTLARYAGAIGMRLIVDLAETAPTSR